MSDSMGIGNEQWIFAEAISMCDGMTGDSGRGMVNRPYPELARKIGRVPSITHRSWNCGGYLSED